MTSKLPKVVTIFWLALPLTGIGQVAVVATNFITAALDTGISVAAVGTNRMLVGSAGGAFLFSTNGALLTTFANLAPNPGDRYFGDRVAAVGADRVMICAPDADVGGTNTGAAYLFDIEGTLLRTFTNPAPNGKGMGSAIAALGTNRIFIAAGDDGTNQPASGVVYLFTDSGALLRIFNAPMPMTLGGFGQAMAAVGNDRVLVGATGNYSGAPPGHAYLFGTNGDLLTTFTSPHASSHDGFGFSVAALGADRVVIGSYGDDTGATDAGAAFLFGTNGTLLMTFTNPIPGVGDFFGSAVAFAGTDSVLVGAYRDDTGATNAGAAYLFSTNGTWLATLANPNPGNNDSFAYSAACLAADRVLVGAPNHGNGVVYLFKIAPAPWLNIQLTATNTVALSWTSPSPGFQLQECTNGGVPAGWSNVNGTIKDDGTMKSFVGGRPVGSKWYRLLK